MKRSLAAAWLLAAACNGPPAPDAAVCQDFIHRICIQPLCPAVTNNVPLTGDCEQTLLAQTGCASDAFTFTSPDRNRFLACRLPLLRAGSSSDTPPNCDDVQDIVTTCPDVIRFLNTPVRDGGP
ncbi:MAG TPA: hypothetical protein VH208_12205 [Myxococcaceae bacterium]|nr:hypothetical protein [Myxococcaceae bacterium]